VIYLDVELDEYYHISFVDPKTEKVVGKEYRFKTLEEVLGFLHSFEEASEAIRERMFVCLMSLRDGESEVTIHRETFNVGDQILKIRPPKGFHKLFWEGHGLKFGKVK